MKILDRNYRLFGVINPIDAVALLLVVAVAMVGYTFLRGGPAVGGDENLTTVRVTLVVRDMRIGPVGIDVGDEVIKSGAGTIGTVTAVSVAPSMREVPVADGSLRLVESELQQDVTVEIEGKGRVADGGVMVGDVLLAVNEQIDMKTPRFAAKVTVFALEPVE